MDTMCPALTRRAGTMQRLRRFSGLAAAALAAWLTATGAAADSPALMIVVDGSGSMAGLLEPKARLPKIALVREALRASITAATPQTRIGLAAFGHRRGGCTDVEIIRVPEPVVVERMMVQLAQLRPRGTAPLTTAVREAAKKLPDDAMPRSLLLIHDSPDTCQQDLCAAAAELSAAGITAHVVSLGLGAEDLAKMAC